MVEHRAAVIGAGPMGLALARCFKFHGIDFRVYEKHADVGGIWDPKNSGSPIYSTAHFISSKTQSAFVDFPMPLNYPDYPSHQQVLEYLRHFARENAVYPNIKFETPVEKVTGNDGAWTVHTSKGQDTYRWLICASGTNWIPNTPQFPGEFAGDIRHAATYKHPSEFARQRVLVVGGGNSAVDIACDAALNADRAAISMRRGYPIIPKHIFGVPTDVFATKGPRLPVKLQQRLFGALLRLVVGDPTRLGLQKADHRLLESHPIVNSQIFHHLSHGNLFARPDIERFENENVVFTNGLKESFDLVVLATGYLWRLPYLPKNLVPTINERPRMILGLFHPERPTLFTAGFLETNAGIYKLFDEMADLIAQTIVTQREDPSAARVLETHLREHRYDVSGGVSYVQSQRHAQYANVDAWRTAVKRLRSTMRWPPLLKNRYSSASDLGRSSVATRGNEIGRP